MWEQYKNMNGLSRTAMTATVSKSGAYLSVVDESGLRHLIRRSAILLVSDEDPAADTTIVCVAGRTIRIPVPLDVVVEALDGNAAASRRTYHPAELPDHLKVALLGSRMDPKHDHLNELLDGE
jgi:hypothetical protein